MTPAQAGVPVGNPFDSLWDWVSAPLAGLSDWAAANIFTGITTWIAKGCVQLLTFVWSVPDRTSSPRLTATWFSGGPDSPYALAARIGGLVLLGVFLVAVAHGVMHGDVAGIVRRTFADLPLTVFAMVALVGLTQAGIDLGDAMTDTVWQGTRPHAVTVFDGLGQIASKLQGQTFLAPLVLLVLMVALLFLWLVLFVRDALIYLVVVLAAAFALPAMVWPALRGMARHSLELLAALVIAKPVIALALAVGVGALGGVGATGSPGDGVIENGLAEYGTLVVGIITFGLAAFMPYLVYRLVSVVTAATVAAGVASGPLRTASTGMQFQSYMHSTFQRLSTNPPPGDTSEGLALGAGSTNGTARAAGTTSTAPFAGAMPGAASGTGGTAAAGGVGSASGAGAAAGAAGAVAGPAVVAVVGAQRATSGVATTAEQLSLDAEGDE